MNSLRDLQATCYRAFTDGSSVLPALVRDNGIAPNRRVGVYRNNHREIFRKALSASFPVVERLVGQACFAGLAREYAREHPSRSGDLQRYGENYPAFLEHTYGGTRFRYLPDVASLEWAVEEVHLDRDEPPLTLAELSRFNKDDYGNLVFSVCRAVRLLRSGFPFFSIWRANQTGSNDRIDLDRGAENVAVVRRGNDVEVHMLDRAAFCLAVALAEGVRLQEAWRPFDRQPGGDDIGAAPDVAGALQVILSLGLLSGVTAAGAPPAHT
ncbi:MAG: DNA-binding domain-containing protein [Rhodospirillaceae bacterium]|nr:DNA-binding domain-containing protein [Rhodospirillaceae bacterium]